MATAERLRSAVGDLIDREGIKPPTEVQDRIKRGRARMKDGAAHREECLAFWRGEQYVHVNSEKYLVKQSTVQNQDGTGKPTHRIRRVYNLIRPIIGRKVSNASSRVPDYEVTPSTIDPDKQNAARLASKIARYGYDQWNLRRVTVDVITYALVAQEGFAWPFFDKSIGPYIQGEDIGVGDVRVRTFGGSEVFWEPGVRFQDSRWHAVEQARSPDEIKQTEGFLGYPLKADAQPNQSSYSHGKGANSKLVMVTDYLERPTPKNPQGCWITIANDRVICTPRDFPLVDAEGNVCDEPVLHKLSFVIDPDSDRDMGLVDDLLDPQRTYNHANNKQTEWLQLALNPQVIIQNGKLRQKLNDTPGAVFEFWGSGTVNWRPVPNIPPELEQIKEDARGIVGLIAGDQELPSGVNAAAAVQLFLDHQQAVWEEFYANLADFHSRLMRHALYLVQRFYTEPRLVQIRGRFGVETIRDFQGANLLGQADVTVLPGSIAPRTKQQIEQKILAYADRGWISPESAMAAIDGGTADALVESYELDVGRAQRIIQRIKAGPEALFGQPDRKVYNPQTDTVDDVPAWMPTRADNLTVQKTIFEDFEKTEEYEQLPPPMQEAFQLYYGQLLKLQAQEQAEAVAAQEAQAAQQGMANAAKPQAPAPASESALTPPTDSPKLRPPNTGHNQR